ncbi:Meiotically up-regulated 65 [Hyphodiscus hymeniophilus]|uniref:Meiotically up-regulated 65 n=1 Tax=Hyphodiscus hymeniophilus TaxID=353542 RepID=A0A9P7B0R2_9HELO|nr:Meiotically up-regulated 65 [Hyphodiscus hymeniophilus]
MSLLHSSKRRPSPLRDVDYDHEISLIDRTRSHSASPARSPGVLSDSSSRRHSDTPLRKRDSLRKEITRRKFSKYQDRHLDSDGPAEGRTDDEPAEERGRTRASSVKGKQQKEHESAIDILYENQRGGFLCGIPLFSSRALGNLDPSQWTNAAQKTSASDITNAQVPDPTWEWAWKEWSVNHQEGVDEDGWEYSFAFSKKFSWHGPSWWNSFVRRRAWIRKRVKSHLGYRVQEGHMLNSDYFTIHPAQDRSRSRASTGNESAKNRFSIAQLARREMEEVVLMEHISDIGSLMRVLRFSRIDREKMEAVENFIQNGGDELVYLKERMHDIMGMFIFQASRRLLLSHILKTFNEALDETNTDADKEPDHTKRQRLENLEAALESADEEVKRLEFWSDIKDMAERGETKGAADASQGWDKTWTGLDSSAPKDVISDRDLPGTDDCEKGERNGTAILDTKKDKGKGKGIAS